MIKEIRYGGHTATPSDYDAPDGDLALSFNLLDADGRGLAPVGQPSPVLTLCPSDRLLAIHSTAAGRAYIIARPVQPKGVQLYWIDTDKHGTDAAHALSIDGALFGSVSDIASVGNTLVVASDAGLCYILWREGAYHTLGAQPPAIAIEFAAVERNPDIFNSSRPLPFSFSEATHDIAQPPIGFTVADDYVTPLSDAVHALVNEQVSERCYRRGYFWQPFFVRYAYRLFDGSHTCVSPPVLLLINTLMPVVSHYGDTLRLGTSSGDRLFPVCGLAYRIVSVDSERLRLWDDIVTGVDIFVSRPVSTYDTQSRIRSFLPFRKAQDGAPAIADSSYNLFYPGVYARPADYLDPRDNDDGTEFIPDVTPDPFPASVDHSYRDIRIPTDASSLIADLYEAASYAQFTPNHDFRKDILSVSAFYHVHSYERASLAAMPSFDWVKVDCHTDPSTLAARPLLSDVDSLSAIRIIPRRLFAFNNRLHAFVIEAALQPPFPIRASMPFGTCAQPGGQYPCVVSVASTYNGSKIARHTPYPAPADYAPADLCFAPAHPPRYFFYPDPNATLALLAEQGVRRFALPLQPADFLVGAHFFGGCAPISAMIAANKLTDTTAATTIASLPSTVAAHNRLFLSEPANPFVFPASLALSVGQGTLHALACAAQALSEGQFGQFPLYAFTSEGVWALETSATGTYLAKQPVSRDVCLPTADVTPIDSAVLFATQRGIMLISGAQTQCLTDIIDADTPFTAEGLPWLGHLQRMLALDGKDACLPVVPFREYLSSCGIVYDYVHQQITLFSPRFRYAYVYSLRTRRWGMRYSRIAYAVPAYPEALAVDADNRVVDFSRVNDTDIRSLLVTRPLKLGLPDIFKTVDTVIQRGRFYRGHVRAVLYASRDLDNWALAWSSADHFLRGFHGSPYKYYRIALLCTLAPGETISGASVQFTPRLVNQPR